MKTKRKLILIILKSILNFISGLFLLIVFGFIYGIYWILKKIINSQRSSLR